MLGPGVNVRFAARMESAQRIHWWQWPNVLALDAALVGVGWLWLVAVELGVDPVLSPEALWVLGLSVWLVYTTDRWLDVRDLPLEKIPTARHAFIKRRSGGLIALWAVVLVLALVLSVGWLGIDQIVDGLALFGLAALHTWLTRKRYFRLPFKEAVIGLAFAASIPVFLWSKAEVYVTPLHVSPDRVLMVFAAGLFGLLCFANCALIAERERAIDVELGRSSVAQRFPGHRYLWAGLAVTAGLMACRVLPPELIGLKLVLLGTGSTLGLLGVLMNKLSPEVFRVLADLAMLTPWVILAFG